MRIKFNHELGADVLNSFSEREAALYFGEKGSDRDEKIITVYGIFFASDCVLYLLCPERSSSFFSIRNSKFYNIIDPRASIYWRFIDNASNDNMVYFDVSFRNFAYIGIDRFVSEPDFFLRYHSEDEGILEYLKEMLVLLEDEANRS